MAQLPPPFHGQSVISGAVYQTLRDIPGTKITHLWKGGAKSATDVGKRSLSKYLQFAQMVLILLFYWATFRRFQIAYLGVAPWAHTISRDAILMFLAKRISARVLVHIHGDGMQRFLDPQTSRDSLVSACFAGTELIAITRDLAHTASASNTFRAVHHLPNFAPDAGTPRTCRRKTLHIGMVSNLDARKGVYEFLATLKELQSRDVKIKGTIIGGPTAALSVEALRNDVEKAGLGKFVTVTGRVSEEVKSELLSDMDVFLYPSRHDLAPLSLIEAISHACVPIVFETGGIPEIIGPDLQSNVLETTLSLEAFSQQAAALIEAYGRDRTILSRDAGFARKQFLDAYSEKNDTSCEK